MRDATDIYIEDCPFLKRFESRFALKGISKLSRFLEMEPETLALVMGGNRGFWLERKTEVEQWLLGDEPEPPAIDKESITRDLDALKRERSLIDSKTTQLNSELESLAKNRIGLSARIHQLEAALR